MTLPVRAKPLIPPYYSEECLVIPKAQKYIIITLKLNTNKNNTPRAWEVLSEDVVEREEDEQHRRGRVDVREVRRAADDRI